MWTLILRIIAKPRNIAIIAVLLVITLLAGGLYYYKIKARLVTGQAEKQATEIVTLAADVKKSAGHSAALRAHYARTEQIEKRAEEIDGMIFRKVGGTDTPKPKNGPSSPGSELGKTYKVEGSPQEKVISDEIIDICNLLFRAFSDGLQPLPDAIGGGKN